MAVPTFSLNDEEAFCADVDFLVSLVFLADHNVSYVGVTNLKMRYR